MLVCCEGHFLTLVTHGSIGCILSVVGKMFYLCPCRPCSDESCFSIARMKFKSTVQHFINVLDLHDGWSLPLNYIYIEECCSIQYHLGSSEPFFPSSLWNSISPALSGTGIATRPQGFGSSDHRKVTIDRI